jgi:hypothetical protein
MGPILVVSEHKFKQRNNAFIAAALHFSHTRVFTNEHNSYLKKGVERPLVMQQLRGSHNIVEELMRMTMKTRRFLTYFSKSGFSIIMLFNMLLYRYMSNRCLTSLWTRIKLCRECLFYMRSNCSTKKFKKNIDQPQITDKLIHIILHILHR